MTKQIQKPKEFHGMYGTPEYRTWDSMIQRCTNPNSAGYAKYGAKGIEVCPEWRNSFTLFYQDMGARPDGTSIDRIDSNGNYTPENCRWATIFEQNSHLKIRKDNSSGYKGVYLDKRPTYKVNKWYAELRRNGKKKYLGHFASPEDAHRARLNALEVV